MQFSLRFKQLCKEKGVTQKKALEDMGFHRNAVQSWSSGSPSADALRKLAGYFDMSTDELLGIETKKAPTPKGERDYSDIELIESVMQANEQQKDLFRMIMRASDQQQEAIRMFLKLK